MGCHFLLQGIFVTQGIFRIGRWILYHCTSWEARATCRCHLNIRCHLIVCTEDTRSPGWWFCQNAWSETNPQEVIRQIQTQRRSPAQLTLFRDVRVRKNKGLRNCSTLKETKRKMATKCSMWFWIGSWISGIKGVILGQLMKCECRLCIE